MQNREGLTERKAYLYDVQWLGYDCRVGGCWTWISLFRGEDDGYEGYGVSLSCAGIDAIKG